VRRIGRFLLKQFGHCWSSTCSVARHLGVVRRWRPSSACERLAIALYDAGQLRPVIDKTFRFDQTLQALAYLEQGRANGKVVITLD
jgi:NADPH:quinone reductase-like Zn-dependent oxidoreductase